MASSVLSNGMINFSINNAKDFFKGKPNIYNNMVETGDITLSEINQEENDK